MAAKSAAKKATTRKRTVNRTAKSERPAPAAAASRAEGRPMRNARSIADFRDILGVLNKDPGKRYRWILSTAEGDKRVFDALRAGWEFVNATKEDNLIIGEYAVGKSEQFGSHYRIPAARRQKDEYMYLMCMPEDFAQEVDAYKQSKVDSSEADILRKRRPEDDEETGQYSEGLTQEISSEERLKMSHPS